jgi:hypothetical protein
MSTYPITSKSYDQELKKNITKIKKSIGQKRTKGLNWLYMLFTYSIEYYYIA